MANKKLYTWGAALYGTLGNGTTTPSVTSPAQIGTDTTWDAIAAGDYHTIAIKNGELFAWGFGGSGRLGTGNTTDQSSPTKIGTATDWSFVATGNDSSFGIRGGKLFAWGSNTSGQLGTGNTSQQNSPIQIGTDTNWLAVSSGGSHTLAIKTDGTLWTWGNAGSGRLGNGTTTPNVTSPAQIGTNTDWTAVAAGSDYSLGIRSGQLFAWGNAAGGRLGDGNSSGSRTTPFQIGTATDWVAIAASQAGSSSLGLRTRDLYAWGLNNSGQLGDGSVTTRTSPTRIGSDSTWDFISAGFNYSMGIKAGELFTWGNAASGKLGNGTTTPNVTSPAKIGSETQWASISAGGSGAFSVALLSANVAPANTAVPTISGTAKVGQTLSKSSDGTWTGIPTPTYSYQWQRADTSGGTYSSISGATSSSYTLVSADAGKYLRLQVTATNVAGSASATSTATSQVLENPAVSTPTVSGTAKVGEVLTASASATAGVPSPSISYQWQVADTSGGSYSNISGATSSTFTLTSAEAGKYIKVQATATNSEGTDTKSSTATSQVLQDVANTALPTISTTDDVLQVGSEMTSTDGSWEGVPAPTYEYQWEVSDDGSTGWTDIPPAVDATYVINSAQAGKYVRLKVTATNSENSAVAYSASSSYISEDPVSVIAPSISGTAKPGATLTATPGVWTGFPNPSFVYSWERSLNGSEDFLPISGATSQTYQPTEGDLDYFIRVVVTGTNEAGEAPAASAPVGPVASGSNSTAAIIGGLMVSGGI